MTSSAGDPSRETLKYVSFDSVVDSGFWHRLTKMKLEVFGLDEKPVPLKAHFYNGDADGLPMRCSVDFSAFDIQQKTPHRCYGMTGTLLNTNTIEKFKELDKQKLLNEEGLKLAEAIKDGRAIEDPNLLNRFLVVTFADLKKYHFIHWFAFPALALPYPVELSEAVRDISSSFSDNEMQQLLTAFDVFYQNTGYGYFAVRKQQGEVQVLPLSQFRPGETMLGFCDPSTDPVHPGWALRNLLTLIAYTSIKEPCRVDVLCLRDRIKDGQRCCRHSLLLGVLLHPVVDVSGLKTVGWEKNRKGQLAPKMVNLSSAMDPKKLSESAVGLNLQLMRWRLQPDLELDAIAGTRCLLFGAGTLGCNVARMLMAWGVRHITLIDNGRVSFSNPARQSLFEFEDSRDGGRPKAQAAAAALKRIHPGLTVEAVELSVPMPGHAVVEKEAERVRGDIRRLEELVEKHDALFLLLDTREARWLPTVLGAAQGKLVINAALGFESFLVMRHGCQRLASSNSPLSSSETNQSPVRGILPGTELGCYFCSDIVAPGNSSRERTLDQQCTVSRPGLSMVAAGLAVELMVSVLQHPLGPGAPFCLDEERNDPGLASGLGIVPHQIRGFFSRFTQLLPGALAFDRCTACSDKVVDTYIREGVDFLLSVFNDERVLEQVSGLSDLQEMHVDILDFDDMDDMDSVASST